MKISVVLPAHNEIDGIERCVRRLMTQDRPLDEIIVVDNNSTDGTDDAVRQLAAEDPRVRLVSETRPGVAHARYAGFAAAQGDVIASVDSDTLVEPTWAGALEAAFTHPEVVAGSGPLIMHDLPFQNRFRRRNARMARLAQKRIDAGRPLRLPALSGANSAIRADVWREIADEVSYRSDLFEDLDRSLLLQDHGHSVVLLPGLEATVSGRRLLAGPRSFLRYAACAPRTYAHRGRRGMAVVAWVTGLAALVSTMAKLPVNRAWDPEREAFSLDRLRGRGVSLRESPIG